MGETSTQAAMGEGTTLGSLALGRSEWLAITQDMVDQFGALTLDPDPMHVDPDWAIRNGPFGGPIVFGFQTLAMLSYFGHQLFESAGLNSRFAPSEGHLLNYGLDRVRFLSPVRVGDRIRANFIRGVMRQESPERQRFDFDVEIEAEERNKPALSLSWIWLWFPRNADGGKDLGDA